MVFQSKTIVLGVSGSIAVYKAAGLARRLNLLGANVHVIMTQNAAKLVSPLIFETLSGNRCITDTFDRNFAWDVKHISLAKAADIFVVAPATANIIGKIAGGICDDMLTTTICATAAPKVIFPAMNTQMYNNPITQGNISKLKNLGYIFAEPDCGRLANGDTGSGRFPEESKVLDILENILFEKKDLQGRKVLVSAGATAEDIDPVRYISNRSTGKMGLALARAAKLRGAELRLVLGENRLDESKIYGMEILRVRSAEEMYNAMTANFAWSDFVFMSAAVADFRPAELQENKIKKSRGVKSLELAENKDILLELGRRKLPGQKICGFSMETENLLENSVKKLEEKNADLIVANDVLQEGAGFGTDSNIVKILSRHGTESLDIQSKESLAHVIIDRLLALDA
ncbi:MAG: bifunctional phosphopantothenoylcysteine decarboxylase/phosphopantothenate--cysteine ligase CoaBC [Oscillospiraceae bacterium]|jgi:phosphopantothenoylcysteine decarboxylase/phosphopantothenate--cysteine ligase|nr:bifunctional phosphopantothenoylcysteine decarboxylase/phosphopantothenate--cysteine ligase CoaBC [Oscillospiraceae bacterium]